MNIKLGQRVKDKVSGFTGVCEHIMYPLHDAIKIGIQAPVLPDGKFGECYTLDAVGVEVMEEAPVVEAVHAKPKYSLGDEAVCTITGFKGIIVAYVIYLNGCVHYRLQPKIPKNAKADDFTAMKFPEGSLKITSPIKKPIEQQRTGGPAERVHKLKNIK